MKSINIPLDTYREGFSNRYQVCAGLSRKVGRLLGVREPKLKYSMNSTWRAWVAMNTSSARIREGRNLGHVPPYLYGTTALGSPERSAERGRMVVEHVEGDTLAEWFRREFFYMVGKDDCPQWENLLKFQDSIRTHMRRLGILPSDFHFKSIMISRETGIKMKTQLENSQTIELGESDRVYVNIDPDGWQFDEPEKRE